MKRAAACGILTLSVAGCGGSGTDVNKISGTNLTIYSSLPEQGASRQDSLSIVHGVQLALAETGGRIGRYRITYKPLDDSIPPAANADPGQTTQNAHVAIDDKTTMGYIGEFGSAASAISIPILNQGGIAQISPSNTAIGLTSNAPGSIPGEPEKYYPTSKRTYARVVPKDTVQTAAQAALQRGQGCRKTFILDDQDVYDQGLARNFKLAAQSQGIAIAAVQGYDPKALSYSSLASGIATTRADCVFIAATVGGNVVVLIKDLAAAVPKAKIFASDGVAQSAYFDPAAGGISHALDARMFLTAPRLPPAAYPPAGQAFLARYRARYGPPGAYAIYGYEAMSLMLDAIMRATDGGRRSAERSRVVAAIFATRDRHSVLGTYSIDSNGDTTLARYGVYRVRNGRLAFWMAIVA